MRYTLLLALAALSQAQSYVTPTTYAAVTTPVYSTAAPSDTCAAQENACRSAPEANESFCSAQRCECDGVPAYCHQSATTTVSAPPAYSSAPVNCTAQEDACRSAPEANEAFCSAQRCQCDGVPSYCPHSTTTTAAAPPAYTSAAVNCTAQEDACRSAPEANESFCSAQRCQCDGVPSYCPHSTTTTASAAPAYTSAAVNCTAQEDACRTAPEANESFCSAQRCQCDGVPAYCHESAAPASATPVAPASVAPASAIPYSTKTAAGAAKGTGAAPSSTLAPYIPNEAAGLKVGAGGLAIAFIGALLV